VDGELMLVQQSGPHVVQRLKDRIDDLEAKIADLKQSLGVDYEYEGLRLLGLTDNQAKLVGILLKRDIATTDQLLTGAYIDHDADKRYEHVKKTVVVPLCMANRKVLRGHGLKIENIHGYGYRMPPESKAKLRSLMATRGAESRAMHG
jgi:hypothetical protein